MMDAGDDPAAREHVTGYFKLHPDFVKIARAAPYPALAREGGRLTIDTPDDLAFVEAVHARMAAKAGEASLADLLLLLEREPRSARHQRPCEAEAAFCPSGGLALIRCDGGGKFGYGHVKRMVALARALRDCESIGVGLRAEWQRRCAGADPPRRFRSRARFRRTTIWPRWSSAQKPDMLILDGREGPAAREAGSAAPRCHADGGDR